MDARETSFTHLIEPFPLERDDDLDKDGDDPSEINIAHNLWSKNTNINSGDTHGIPHMSVHIRLFTEGILCALCSIKYVEIWILSRTAAALRVS